MNRFQLSKTLPLMMLVSAAAWTGHAADLSRGAMLPAAKSTYTVRFHVNAPTTVPDGATVMCKARITRNLSALENLIHKSASVEATPGSATVANSSANCTVEIPLAFAVSNLQNGASLSYQIDAYTGSGPVFARTQEGIAVGYPQLAGGTELSVDVAF